MKKQFKFAWIFTSFICFTLMASLSHAATLTVAQDGSGDFTTIQAAVDAAAEGDEIIISGGTYAEDVTIGHLNLPPLKKDNLTLRAAEGETVIIDLPNESDRVQALPLDFGDVDILGVFIYGDNVVLDGLTINQPTTTVNMLEAAPSAAAMTIISPNVNIRNCTINGSGAFDGDIIGILLANLDAVSAAQGSFVLATDLTVDGCTFTGHNFAFATNNFLAALGIPAPNPSASVANTVFSNNGTGIEMDDGTVTVDGCEFLENETGISVAEHILEVRNSIFRDNTEFAVETETGDIPDDAPEEIPTVLLENCVITGNGNEDDQAGIVIESGNLTARFCVLSNNYLGNAFLKPDDARNVSATFINCDFYRSQGETSVVTAGDPEGIIDITLINCNIVDVIGIDNLAEFVASITLTNCNIFASDVATIGDPDTFTIENLLEVDPMYVDAENGDFSLSPDSPVATAGVDGTFIGAFGINTPVRDWAIQ